MTSHKLLICCEHHQRHGDTDYNGMRQALVRRVGEGNENSCVAAHTILRHATAACLDTSSRSSVIQESTWIKV